MSESRVYLLNLDEQNTNDVVSTNQLPPVMKEVTFLRNHSVRQIACGVTQTVFVLFDGSVYSYEHDEIKNDKELPNPKRFSSLDKFFIVQAACGDSHSVVISDKGQIMSWGRDTEGQCGRGNVNPEGRPTPRIIKSLSKENIVQVACGSKHTLALAKNGKLYAWGDNSNGQLGFSPTPDLVCAVPTQVSCLNPRLSIQRLSCGDKHSLVLMSSGAVFGWGCNTSKQLGECNQKAFFSFTNFWWRNDRGKMMKLFPPFKPMLAEKDQVQIDGISKWISTQVQAITAMPEYQRKSFEAITAMPEYQSKSFEELRYEHNILLSSKLPDKLPGLLSIEHISAGEGHSVFISKNGEVFGFGKHFTETNVWSNKLEELSEEKDKVIICSKLHFIILIPLKNKLYVFGPKASGDNFSTTISTEMNELVTGSVGRTESCVNSQKVFNFLSCHISADILKSLENVYGGGNRFYLVTSDLLSKIEISPDSTSDHQMYELNDYSISQIAASSEPIPKKISLLIQNLFSMACLNRSFLTSDDHYCCKDSPGLDISRAKESFTALSEKHHVLSKISEVIHNQLCPALLESPHDLEVLRVYLLLLEFPTMQYPEFYLPSICSVAKALCRLSPKMSKVIDGWLGNYLPQDFQHLVVIFKNVLVHFVSKQIHSIPVCIDIQDVTIALDMLNKLYKINEENREIIPYTSFYIPEVKLLLDWWIQNGFQVMVKFHEYPCVLEKELKMNIIIFDNMVQKKAAIKKELWMFSWFGGWLNPLFPVRFSDLLLLVSVDRQNIVSSTIMEFGKYDQEDFKKPLKVHFTGEPGVDDGAVSKEFFQLIFKEVLDPNFGMFKVFSKTDKLWFNPQSLMDNSMFRLVGTLCGLAMYNQVVVDLPFPEVLYKKLLKKPIYLLDLKDLDPTMTESLQSILNYDDYDLQDVFDMYFEFSSEFHGDVCTVELMEGGSKIPLTYDNKQEYVDLYIDYLLDKSVKTRYRAFEEGFLWVCGGPVLDMFHPEELMMMVVGDKIYDWQEFERSVEYRGVFNKKHRTIKYFWDVFHEFTIEEKKKFLEFLTGSDRIALHGMSRLKVIIEPPVGNNSTDLLPTAQTCYNRLFLPLYETKKKMKQKLLITLENSVGFGLV